MTSVLQRSADTVPPLAVSASGLIIRLADGREIIDATGGAAVACIGHGNKQVRDAILEQLDKVAYVHTMAFTAPVTCVAPECFDANGSRTTKRSSGESHGMRSACSCSPPRLSDIADAKLHTDESQPVDPAPVETMTPLLLWRSHDS